MYGTWSYNSNWSTDPDFFQARIFIFQACPCLQARFLGSGVDPDADWLTDYYISINHLSQVVHGRPQWLHGISLGLSRYWRPKFFLASTTFWLTLVTTRRTAYGCQFLVFIKSVGLYAVAQKLHFFIHHIHTTIIHYKRDKIFSRNWYRLLLPSVLWRCWLGGRKGIRPVKNRVVGCWRGYLSGARCRLAYGPADATATHCLLLQ